MKTKIVLIFICILGLFLRFFNIGESPRSLYWDEASIGYNAFSILNTGKDEWGKDYPLFFKAFNEYKLPVPVYFDVFSIKMFGLNEFGVRFPSMIFGVLSCLAMYFFVQKLITCFPDLQFIKNMRTKISLISAFIFSISGWSLQFSRAMFEANIALFFEIIACIFLLEYLKKGKVLSLIILATSIFLCVYSYTVQFMSMFFLIILSGLILNIRRTWKRLLVVIFIYSLISLPFYLHAKSDGLLRFEQVSIAGESQFLEKIISLRIRYGEWSKLIFNQYLVYGYEYLSNILKHFNPFFFFPGVEGNARHNAGTGLLTFFEYFVFCYFWFYLLLKRKIRIFAIFLLLTILMFSPASLTNPSPHALRALNALPFVIFMISSGAILIFAFLKSIYIKILLLIIFVSGLNYYLVIYHRIYPIKNSGSWGYQNKIMAQMAGDFSKKFKYVYVSGDFWRPYIYYYFYNQIDPLQVIQNNDSTRFNNVYFGYAKFDKADERYDYFFKPENIIFSGKKTVAFLSESENHAFSKRMQNDNYSLKKVLKIDGGDIYIYEN